MIPFGWMLKGVNLHMEQQMSDFKFLPTVSTVHSSKGQTVSTAFTRNSAQFSYTIGSPMLMVDELLRNAPSFSSFMRQTLVNAMKGFAKTNPDLLFINTSGDDGSLSSSMTLTQGFCKFLMHGSNFLEADNCSVYVRRDSTLSAYLEIGHFNKAGVLAAFKGLAAGFWPNYERALGEYWHLENEASAQSSGNTEPASRRETLGASFLSVIREEVNFAQATKSFSQSDVDVCRTALNQVIPGFHVPVVVNANGDRYEVTGCLVYSPDADLSAKPTDHPLYAFDLIDGWKKYPTSDAFEQVLHQRIGDPEKAASLLASMPASVAQEVIDLGAEFSELTCTYKGMYRAVTSYFADAFIHKQFSDVLSEFGLLREEAHGIKFVLSELDACAALEDVSLATHGRINRISGWEKASTEPDWLQYGDSTEREEYSRLENKARDKKLKLTELTGIVNSPEHHARTKIAAYLESKLWYTIDPEHVVIEIKDQLPLADEQFVVSYKKTLLEFVLSGVPTIEKLASFNVTVPEGYESSRWTLSFIRTMVEELSVTSEFARAMIQTHQRTPQIRSAAIELAAARMELSALAARMRGHIGSQTHEALIGALYGDKRNQNLRIGGVWLRDAQRRFEDVIVFKGLSPEKPFLLYAPGAPVEWEFSEFYDWRRLSMEICGWAVKREGAAYIDDQVAISLQDKAVGLSFSARIKPHEWTEQILTFVEVGAGNMLTALESAVEHKSGCVLMRGDYIRRAKSASQFPLEVQKKVTVDARFSAFAKYFNSISGLMPYRDAARLECKRLINELLKRKQIDMEVDPDTVYYDLTSPEIQSDPDFGPYTSLRTLTDIFVEGFSQENYAFHTDVAWYSSVGQDLSAITPAFIDNAIRNCDFAERYLKRVQRHKSKDIVQNNQRYAAYECALRYKMHSDAIKDYSAQRLDSDQYQFITALIGLPHPIKGIATTSTPAGGLVKPLVINGATIHGAYVLFKKGLSDAKLFLVYTPDAPDDISFRPGSSLIASINHAEMDKYFYHRVNFGRQRIIGTVIDDVKNRRGHHQLVEPEYDGPSTVNWKREYDTVLDHLYKDADAQTESGYERLFLGWYLSFREYGEYVVKYIPGPAGLKLRILWHVLHAIVDLSRGIHIYRTGDRAAAKDFFFSAADEAYSAAKAGRKYRKAMKKNRIKRKRDKHNNVIDVLASI